MVSSDSPKSTRDVTERSTSSPVAGRYRLSHKIGEGGMGSVWFAHDLLLDATCAVKLIDKDKAADAEILTRFAREAKASAQLRSPHVVNVFDYGEWEGSHYIAMEYLEGEDLATRLSRLGRLEPEPTYRIVAHVARALMSAHSLGIVHRDLKPENIFLVQRYDEEIAKVLDFGIAQNQAYSLENRATREGTFLGTPCYMSPEQVRGKPVDHRSDIWSLGVIVFQCLTGRLPFESDALGELMGMILYEPLPKITTFNGELPPGIDFWWERATARDRELRFFSAKEQADELGVLLGIGSVVNVPSGRPRHISSFPPGNEKSGVITAPNVRRADAAVVTQEPRAGLSSLVHAMSAMAGTMDEVVSEKTSQASRTQGLQNLLTASVRRFHSLGTYAKWAVLAIPAVVLFLVLGIVLGLSIKGKTTSQTQPLAAPADSASRAPASRHADPQSSPVRMPDTLTVNMLPLVSPSGQPGRSNVGDGARKSEPGSNRPPTAPRTPARDYGI